MRTVRDLILHLQKLDPDTFVFEGHMVFQPSDFSRLTPRHVGYITDDREVCFGNIIGTDSTKLKGKEIIIL